MSNNDEYFRSILIPEILYLRLNLLTNLPSGNNWMSGSMTDSDYEAMLSRLALPNLMQIYHCVLAACVLPGLTSVNAGYLCVPTISTVP